MPEMRIHWPRRAPRDDEGIICYQCAEGQRGREAFENHHPYGKAVDRATTAAIHGNMHRMVSDMDYETPEEVTNNRQQNPLLLITGFICSVRNVARFIVDHGGQIIPWLVLFYHRLVEKHGPR